jgi:hypothetical protein
MARRRAVEPLAEALRERKLKVFKDVHDVDHRQPGAAPRHAGIAEVRPCRGANCRLPARPCRPDSSGRRRPSTRRSGGFHLASLPGWAPGIGCVPCRSSTTRHIQTAKVGSVEPARDEGLGSRRSLVGRRTTPEPIDEVTWLIVEGARVAPPSRAAGVVLTSKMSQPTSAQTEVPVIKAVIRQISFPSQAKRAGSSANTSSTTSERRSVAG